MVRSSSEGGMEKISAAILNFNGQRTLLKTIEALYAQEGYDVEVVLVDDASTDGSPEAALAAFPRVKLIQMPENTKDVSRLRNMGIRASSTEKVLLVDNDHVLAPNCLHELATAMDEDPSVGCCLPRLMYLDQPDKVNMCGVRMHYIGASIDTERNKALGEAELQTRIGIGGGVALFRRQVFDYVGGFDEDFMLAWGDDGELHQRILLAGYKSLYVHSAQGLHEVKEFNEARSYRALGQTYNRWLFLLTHYDLRTLILIAPALMFYELIQFGYLTINGFPKLYLEANWKVIRALPLIKEKRKAKQAIKRASDRDLLDAGPILVVTSKVGFNPLINFAIQSVSTLLNSYWYLVRGLLKKSQTPINTEATSRL